LVPAEVPSLPTYSKYPTCQDEVPSENWIRNEWKLERRKSYSGNNFTGTTATLFK